MTPPISRRSFLIAITGSALAAAAGCRPEGAPAPTAYAPGGSPQPGPATQPAKPVSTADVAVNPGTPDPMYGKVTYDKLMITDVNNLYVTQYSYDQTPEIDANTWSMRVDGLVTNPISLDYKAIKAFPSFEDTRTLECIGNPVGGDLIGNIQWRGFKFQEILDQVKPLQNATHVKFGCADGYETSVELRWLTQPNVMMAYEANGQPLNTVHGFPIRILTPGLYGQKMPRWITRMEFIDHYFKGFWESRGWSDVASVQTNSIIQTPPRGYSLKAGSTVAIQGVAWAGTRAITKVEVQIENGPWLPTTLVHGPSPLSWTQWHVLWTFTAPGAYKIGVRATDDTGFVQQSEGGGIFGDSSLDGSSAIHRIDVQVS